MNKIIMFTQPTCVPCKQLKPHLYAVSSKFSLEVEEIDISVYTEYIYDFQIRSTPTVIVFDENGQELTRLKERTTLKLIEELATFRQ